MVSKKIFLILFSVIFVFILGTGNGFTTEGNQPFKKVKELIEENKYNPAIRELNEFLKMNKNKGKNLDKAKAYFLLAWIYFDWKENKLSVAYLTDLFKISPNFDVEVDDLYFKKKLIADDYFHKKFMEIKKKLAQQHVKVSKNKEGFWEKEFTEGITMVYIPGGEFEMGSGRGDPDEIPPHKVQLDGYWIGKYEITIGQYKKFIAESGHRALPQWVSKYSKDDRYPVVGVSWNDAAAFCKWLSSKTGKNFNLPTEAQWEKAARGIYGRRYPWGNSSPDCNKVNYYKCGKELVPVGTLHSGKSIYGIYEMAGNVWEWCWDWYSRDYYEKAKEFENPDGPSGGTFRVIRGGSFMDREDDVRSANRMGCKPESRARNIGFRIYLREMLDF